MNKETIEIAPGFTCKDWTALDLAVPENSDWKKAIAALKSRIYDRYIKPVDILISHEKPKHYLKRRFGFTILAIDCLLIETLQAFKDGREETKQGKGKKVFVEFLIKSEFLGKHFNKEYAEKFYDYYRNGILHQAQIKSDALVWSISKVVHTVDGSMVINRTEFHNCLKKDFNHYLDELNDKNNTVLRNNFKSKMDTLCK